MESRSDIPAVVSSLFHRVARNAALLLSTTKKYEIVYNMGLNLRHKVIVGFGFAALMIVINAFMVFTVMEKHEKITVDLFENKLSECSTEDVRETQRYAMALNKRVRTMVTTTALISAFMIILIGYFISRHIPFREEGKTPDSVKGELLSIMKNLDGVIRKL